MPGNLTSGYERLTLRTLSDPPHHRNAPLHRPSLDELTCGFVAVAQQGQGCDGFGHDARVSRAAL